MDTRPARPRRRHTDLLDGWFRVAIAACCSGLWVSYGLGVLLAPEAQELVSLALGCAGLSLPFVWWLAIKTLRASFADRAAARAERMAVDFSSVKPPGTTSG